MRSYRLLFLVLLVCVGFAILAVSSKGGKEDQEDHFRRILEADPRIENISFEGYEGGQKRGQNDLARKGVRVRRRKPEEGSE
jgi:hypothetical protein